MTFSVSSIPLIAWEILDLNQRQEIDYFYEKLKLLLLLLLYQKNDHILFILNFKCLFLLKNKLFDFSKKLLRLLFKVVKISVVNCFGEFMAILKTAQNE